MLNNLADGLCSEEDPAQTVKHFSWSAGSFELTCSNRAIWGLGIGPTFTVGGNEHYDSFRIALGWLYLSIRTGPILTGPWHIR